MTMLFLKKIGLMGIALMLAMLGFMAWLFGGTFVSWWITVKSDEAREIGRNMLSDEDKLSVYRRMIADDSTIKEKIHDIATLQREIEQERKNQENAEEEIASLAEMVTILRDDLVQNPDKDTFTYRTVDQSQIRTFQRHAVERDLLTKSKALATRKERLVAIKTKVEAMERRKGILDHKLDEYKIIRDNANHEIETAELLRIVADEINMEVAMLTAPEGIETLDVIQRGATEVRQLNEALRQKIEEGKLLLGTKQVSGLDPRPASSIIDAVTAANAVLDNAPVPPIVDFSADDGANESAFKIDEIR